MYFIFKTISIVNHRLQKKMCCMHAIYSWYWDFSSLAKGFLVQLSTLTDQSMGGCWHFLFVVIPQWSVFANLKINLKIFFYYVFTLTCQIIVQQILLLCCGEKTHTYSTLLAPIHLIISENFPSKPDFHLHKWEKILSTQPY